MLDYETAVMFEKAGNVRRTLESAGRLPTIEDDRYINELRYKLNRGQERFLNELTERYPHL